jgi:hypothetical protein
MLLVWLMIEDRRDWGETNDGPLVSPPPQIFFLPKNNFVIGCRVEEGQKKKKRSGMRGWERSVYLGLVQTNLPPLLN